VRELKKNHGHIVRVECCFLPACSLPSPAAKPSGDSVLINTADGPLTVSAPPNMLIPTVLFVDSWTKLTVKLPPGGDVGKNTLSFVACNKISVLILHACHDPYTCI